MDDTDDAPRGEPATPAELDEFYAAMPVAPPPTDAELDDMAARWAPPEPTPF